MAAFAVLCMRLLDLVESSFLCYLVSPRLQVIDGALAKAGMQKVGKVADRAAEGAWVQYAVASAVARR